MNIFINNVKIEVSAPRENVEDIRKAICDTGAGIIGNYTDCSLSTRCTCTFKPNEDAHPYIGDINNLEVVQEEKLEVLCKIIDAKKVINAIREHHPYEEVVINIIPLIDENVL